MIKKLFNKLRSKKEVKTIGVFYICTGRYNIFWERFYRSAEKYFCPGIKKHYFIFTDQEINPAGPDVTIVHQDKLGWPYDTLMRFHMFNGVREQAMQFDYLYFFNANMVFLSKVKPKQILPEGEDKLVGTLHPFFYGGTEGAPYETNKESAAYVNHEEARHYVAGGLSGGLAADYLSMSAEIAANIDKDQSKGIIAIWHDESHINAYFSKLKQYKILNPGYIVPEKRLKNFPFKPYLVVLDKVFAGGHELLRG
ncbi:MAG: family 6 glucosyltransferase [Bacteroidota bacterium]